MNEATQRLTIEVVAKAEAEKVLAQLRGSLSALGMGDVSQNADLMTSSLNKAFGVFGRFGDGARTVVGKLMAMATGVKTVDEGIGKLGEALTSGENQLAAFGVAVGALAIGAGKLATMLGDRLVAASRSWFNEAIKAERVTLAVGASLDAFIDGTGDASLSLKELITLTEKLSRSLGISQTELLQSSQFMIDMAKNLELTGDQMEQLLTRAAQVSVTRSKDVSTTLRAMVLGLSGVGRQLQRTFGIKIDDSSIARWAKTTEAAFRNMPEHEKTMLRFGKIMEDTGSSAEGAAKIIGGSLAKQLDVAKAAIEQFHEALGKGAATVFGPMVILYAGFAKMLLRLPSAFTGAIGATTAFTGVLAKGVGEVLIYAGSLATIVQGLIIVRQTAKGTAIATALGSLGTTLTSITTFRAAMLLLAASFKTAAVAAGGFLLAMTPYLLVAGLVTIAILALKRAFDLMETGGHERQFLTIEQAIRVMNTALEIADGVIRILAGSLLTLAVMANLTAMAVVMLAKAWSKFANTFGANRPTDEWDGLADTISRSNDALTEARDRAFGIVPPLKSVNAELTDTELAAKKAEAEVARIAAATALLAQQMRSVKIATVTSMASIALAAGQEEAYLKLQEKISKLQTADQPAPVARRQLRLDENAALVGVVKNRVTLAREADQATQDRAAKEAEAASAELQRVQKLRGIHQASAAEVLVAIKAEGAAKQQVATIEAQNADANAKRMREATEQVQARNARGGVQTGLPFTAEEVTMAEQNAKRLRAVVGEEVQGLAADIKVFADQASAEANQLSLFGMEKARAGNALRTELLQEYMTRMVEAAKIGTATDAEALAAAQAYEDQLRANILAARDFAKAELERAGSDPKQRQALQIAFDEAEARTKAMGLLVPEVVKKTKKELETGVLDVGKFVQSSVGQVGDALVDAVTSKGGGASISTAFKGIATSFTKNVVNTIIEDKTKGLDAKLKVNFLKDIPGWVDDGAQESRASWDGAWKEGAKAVDAMGAGTKQSVEKAGAAVADVSKTATDESTSLWGTFFDWIVEAGGSAFGALGDIIMGILGLFTGQGSGSSGSNLAGLAVGAGNLLFGGGGSGAAASGGMSAVDAGNWAIAEGVAGGAGDAVTIASATRQGGGGAPRALLGAAGVAKRLGVFGALFGEEGALPFVGKAYNDLTAPLSGALKDVFGASTMSALGTVGSLGMLGLSAAGLFGKGPASQKLMSGAGVAHSLGSLYFGTQAGQATAQMIATDYPAMSPFASTLLGANMQYGVPGGLIGPAAPAGQGLGWGYTLGRAGEAVMQTPYLGAGLRTAGGYAANAYNTVAGYAGYGVAAPAYAGLGAALPVGTGTVLAPAAAAPALGAALPVGTGTVLAPAAAAGTAAAGTAGGAVAGLGAQIASMIANTLGAMAGPLMVAVGAYSMVTGIQAAMKADTDMGKAAGAASAAAGLAGMMVGLYAVIYGLLYVPIIGWIIAIVLAIVAIILSVLTPKPDFGEIIRKKLANTLTGFGKGVFDPKLKDYSGQGTSPKTVEAKLGGHEGAFRLLTEMLIAAYGRSMLRRMSRWREIYNMIVNNITLLDVDATKFLKFVFKTMFKTVWHALALANRHATARKEGGPREDTNSGNTWGGMKPYSAAQLDARFVELKWLMEQWAANTTNTKGEPVGPAGGIVSGEKVASYLTRAMFDKWGVVDIKKLMQAWARGIFAAWESGIQPTKKEIRTSGDPLLRAVNGMMKMYQSSPTMRREILQLASAVNEFRLEVKHIPAMFLDAFLLMRNVAAAGYLPPKSYFGQAEIDRVARQKMLRKRGVGRKRGKKQTLAMATGRIIARAKIREARLGYLGGAIGAPEWMQATVAREHLTAAQETIDATQTDLIENKKLQRGHKGAGKKRADAEKVITDQTDKAIEAVGKLGEALTGIVTRIRDLNKELRDFHLTMGEDIDALTHATGTADRYNGAIHDSMGLLSKATLPLDKLYHAKNTLELIRQQHAAYIQDIQDEATVRQEAFTIRQETRSDRQEEIAPLAGQSAHLTEQLRMIQQIRPEEPWSEMKRLRIGIGQLGEIFHAQDATPEEIGQAVSEMSTKYDALIALADKTYGPGSMDARRVRAEATAALSPFERQALIYAKEQREQNREQKKDEKEQRLADRETRKRVKEADAAFAPILAVWDVAMGQLWKAQSAELRRELEQSMPGLSAQEYQDMIDNPQSAAMRIALYQSVLLESIDKTLRDAYATANGQGVDVGNGPPGQVTQEEGWTMNAGTNAEGPVLNFQMSAGAAWQKSGVLKADEWVKVRRRLWAMLDTMHDEIDIWIGQKPPNAEGNGGEGHFGASVPLMLASGGIAMQATRAVVGEAGPEMVIPLSGPVGRRAILQAFSDLAGRLVQRGPRPSATSLDFGGMGGSTGIGGGSITITNHIHITVKPGAKREDAEMFAAVASDALEARMVKSLETGALGRRMRQRGMLGK